jgi:hypothetical protein
MQRRRHAELAALCQGLVTRLLTGMCHVLKEERVFFFEKKKQKTFIRCRGLPISARLKKQKFFGSFFQKRTFFLYLFPF